MSEQLKGEQAQRILDADLKNLVQKVRDGKTLTEAQRHRMLQLTADRFAKNQTELAKHFGVDRKTIQRWRKQADFPKPKADGRWDISAVRDWREATRGKNGEEEEYSKSEGEARKVWLQVEKLEHELEVSRGKYIEVEEASRIITELITIARGQFIGLADRLAPIVVGGTIAEASSRISSEIDQILESISTEALKDDRTEEGDS